MDRLARLLAEHPGLATVRLGDYDGRADGGMSRTLLHVVTDWPGHFPNGAATVSALVGAEVDARFTGPHNETPLHWAASSNDVAVLDALLDAGADIDADGAVIGGGTPLADARAFAQRQAAHRLADRVEQFFTAATPTRAAGDHPGILGSLPRWAAAGRAVPTRPRGADPNWIPPWEDLTPLDAAARRGATDLTRWLRAHGARTAAELNR